MSGTACAVPPARLLGAQGKQQRDWSSLADIAAADTGLVHKPGPAE